MSGSGRLCDAGVETGKMESNKILHQLKDSR